MSTEHLVRTRKKIMTHETNPIYHQPQPLINMKSNNGAAMAESSKSAIHHEGKIKFENFNHIEIIYMNCWGVL